MANNKLLTIVTFMILSATSGATQQSPTLDNLLAIEKLIDNRDWRTLQGYIAANPHLTQGNTALASELRNFSNEMQRSDVTAFNAPRGVTDRNAGAFRARSTRTAEIY